MMAKDPDHRYQDPDDLISDLLSLAGQLGLQPFNLSGKTRLPKPAARVSLFTGTCRGWLPSPLWDAC